MSLEKRNLQTTYPSAKPSDGTELTEEYNNFVTSSAVPKTMSLHEIAKETNKEGLFHKDLAWKFCDSSSTVTTGFWESVDLSYKAIKEELSIGAQNIILRGSRIVIPLSLQQKAIASCMKVIRGFPKQKL